MASTTTTTTTTITTAAGATTTTTTTVTTTAHGAGLALEFGDATATAAAATAPANDSLSIPTTKECITAEWLTLAMHEYGSLPADVTVTQLHVDFLKGEADPAAGGVATALAGGVVLKLSLSYSNDAGLPATMIAKLMPKAAYSTFDPDDRLDQSEVWAYTSGSSKLCLGPDCYFAKYWTQEMLQVEGYVSVALLLLEDLSADYDDNGGGIQSFLDVRYDQRPRALYEPLAQALANLHTATNDGTQPDAMLPPEVFFAPGEYAKAKEVIGELPPFKPETSCADIYAAAAIGQPYTEIYTHYVRTRVNEAQVEALLARQEETGIAMRLIVDEPEGSVGAAEQKEFCERLASPDAHFVSLGFLRQPHMIQLMRRLGSAWVPYLDSEAGKAQLARLRATTCIVHGDMHLGNAMWSEKLQQLKLFDFQGMGRAPAATDLAYFLRQIDVGKEGTAAAERIELVLQTYTAAAAQNGNIYPIDELRDDIAFLSLQRLLHLLADTPINDNILAWQGEDAKLFTGCCQVKYDPVYATPGWLAAVAAMIGCADVDKLADALDPNCYATLALHMLKCNGPSSPLAAALAL